MTSPEKRPPRRKSGESSSSSSLSPGTVDLLNEITSSNVIPAARQTSAPASESSSLTYRGRATSVGAIPLTSPPPEPLEYMEEGRLSTASTSSPTGSTVIYRHLSELTRAGSPTEVMEEVRTPSPSGFPVASLLSSNSSGSLSISPEMLPSPPSEESATSLVVRRPRIGRLTYASLREKSPRMETSFASGTITRSSDSEISSLYAPGGSLSPHRKSKRSSLFIKSPIVQDSHRRTDRDSLGKNLSSPQSKPILCPSSSSTTPPERFPTTSQSSSSSSIGSSSESTDSLTRELLQPPAPISSDQESNIQGVGDVSPPQSAQSETSQKRRASVTEEQFTSPRRKSKRRSQLFTTTDVTTGIQDSSLETRKTSCFKPTSSYLAATSALFFMKHKSPPVMRKPPKKELPVSIAVDPQFIGEEVYSNALREGAILDDELNNNAKSIEWMLSPRKRCPCDVRKHPGTWSWEVIQNVHKYSFLLHCKDLRMLRQSIVGWNRRETIIFYQVVMVDGNPWKKKAEQVLRFIDVELDVGDQTAYNVLYYVQPCDRKILLVIIMDRVVGLLVAEKQLLAYRPHIETVSYRELEENPVPVKIGINQLWVHVSLRRYGLATKLCDIMRKVFNYPELLKNEDFAFNDVSEMGVRFAKKFLGTSKVPLYCGKPGK